MSDHLFVYGTLMTHHVNPFATLLRRHARLVGRAKFQGKLYLAGKYPAVVPSTNARDVVHGELFRLIDKRIIQAIDDYEGCAAAGNDHAEYRRVRLNVTTYRGASVAAWIYVYNRDPMRLKHLPGGRYR